MPVRAEHRLGRPAGARLRVRLTFATVAAISCSRDQSDRPGPTTGAGSGAGAGGAMAGHLGSDGGAGRSSMGGASGSGGVAGGTASAGAAGSAVSAGGTGGAGSAGTAGANDAGPKQDAGQASAVSPVQNQSRWRFSWGNSFLEVDPQVGGRIVGFGRNTTNLLTGPTVNTENWGSTFWPSPQKAWNAATWPPPPEIDLRPYTIVSSAADLQLLGDTNATAGVRARKTFVVNAGADRVQVRYQFESGGGAAVSVAPWEVTRVFDTGLVFFGLGPGGNRGGQLQVTTTNGVAWIALGPNASPGKQFADGQGWIAYADSTHRLLFVKDFPDIDVASFAPGESEIEIFVSDKKDYVEIENQGAYESVATDRPLTWTVGWSVREIPPNVDVSPGSVALQQLATALLGR